MGLALIHTLTGTDTEAAMIAGIAAAPADRTGPLVLADFYDEHGHHARAEYLRLTQTVPNITELSKWAQSKCYSMLAKMVARYQRETGQATGLIPQSAGLNTKLPRLNALRQTCLLITYRAMWTARRCRTCRGTGKLVQVIPKPRPSLRELWLKNGPNAPDPPLISLEPAHMERNCEACSGLGDTGGAVELKASLQWVGGFPRFAHINTGLANDAGVTAGPSLGLMRLCTAFPTISRVYLDGISPHQIGPSVWRFTAAESPRHKFDYSSSRIPDWVGFAGHFNSRQKAIDALASAVPEAVRRRVAIMDPDLLGPAPPAQSPPAAPAAAPEFLRRGPFPS